MEKGMNYRLKLRVVREVWDDYVPYRPFNDMGQ